MRRAFVAHLQPGRLALDAGEAHHVRDVLRAAVGDAIELFDAAGRSAVASIAALSRDGVWVEIAEVIEAASGVQIVVASAVPKHERADWLVEKLSEVGVARWVPLQTTRSVVHPSGPSKFERWRRIAIESAKQSRRIGVMAIAPLTAVTDLAWIGDAAVLSTRPGCVPLATIVAATTASSRTLLIGPEGGWTDEELDALRTRGAVEASLTNTVLRIETAAVLAAGIWASA